VLADLAGEVLSLTCGTSASLPSEKNYIGNQPLSLRLIEFNLESIDINQRRSQDSCPEPGDIYWSSYRTTFGWES